MWTMPHPYFTSEVKRCSQMDCSSAAEHGGHLQVLSSTTGASDDGPRLQLEVSGAPNAHICEDVTTMCVHVEMFHPARFLSMFSHFGTTLYLK